MEAERKENLLTLISTRQKHVTCYNCGKKGHIKNDCHFRRKQKKENALNVQVAKTKVEEIIAMVSNLHISMVTVLTWREQLSHVTGGIILVVPFMFVMIRISSQ